MDTTRVQAPGTALLIVNSDVRAQLGLGPQHTTHDPQFRSMLQWVAASMADTPQILLSRDGALQQVNTLLTQLH